MDRKTKACVNRKCLVCNLTKKVKETKRGYLRIQVCPNCKGAFVDTFYLGLYEKV